jgi:polysaccharide export outer membrane protein
MCNWTKTFQNLQRMSPAGLLLALCCAANAQTQQPQQASLVRTGTPLAVGPILPASRLGADDMLEIEVSHCPELTRTFRVGADGNLALPLLTRPLAVAGLTPVELTQKLRDELIHEQILMEPVVNISVVEYRSRPVSVVGSVVHPITFQATGRTTLLDALATAGGLSPVAGGNILVTGVHDGAGANAVRIIPVKDLIGGNVPDDNLQLQGGEEIRVPEAPKIFVAGNVVHPGMFPMQGDNSTTVVKAIALSSGLAPFCGRYAYIYRKKPGAGDAREEVKVSLSKIMDHHSADVAMMPDDILFIPASNGKKAASKILAAATGVGQEAGGFAIVR